MENTNSKPLEFVVFRRNPRDGWKVPVGIGLIITGIIQGLLMCYIAYVAQLEFLSGVAGIAMLVSVILIVTGILIAAESGQKTGSIVIDQNQIRYQCKKEKIVFLPGQITSVLQEGNVVSIAYQGKTFKVIVPKAAELVSNINAFIEACPANNTQVSAPNAFNDVGKQGEVETQPVNILDPVTIREYKKLVDDGVISQEQFEEIVRKNT